MKLLYTHENPALVGYAKSLLESEGIQVAMKNQYGAAGLAPPHNLWQELWVDETDYERAAGLLDGLDEARQDPKPD